MSDLQPGVFLGRYELLARIGRGGMASVWVARERSAVSGKQRLVAVKAMLPELARHSEFRSMFLGEVQIIQSIQHDNVVRVFEVSEDKNILYMVMEWVEGDSLRNIIRASKSRGALPPEIAVCVAADAAAGLHAAHDLRDWDGELRGVVHCDVSPHNILVGLDGKAKLVDFGIANAMGSLERGGDAETIKGKLSYMSPEQARGERVDRRTDVSALGIVLFEMTTGEQLFKGRDVAHTIELVKGGTIPRPSLLNQRYPPKLEQIVLKALERDPRRRYQTAEEFEFVLSSYLTEEHTVVSHPVVARLLMQLLGARVEKRRDVITSIVNALDTNRPVGSIAGRASWNPDLPIPNDPLNFTLTGHSESGLGIAARLEDHTTAAIPISNRPSALGAASSTWRWIGAAGLLLGMAVGAGYYLYVVRPRQAEAAAFRQVIGSETATLRPQRTRAPSEATRL
jgi:serine/threonine protein kinase